ncbi:MAG: hypothetical protein J6Q68_03195 [Clostridia bacterium]|nr:hypothetical protein [Clostridia bacterium]
MKTFKFETKNFTLSIREDAVAESLINKKTGEEMLDTSSRVSIFSVTQLRPYNNEVKLAYMNKRTTFEAKKMSVDGNKITVDFEIIPYSAVITVDVKDEYITFTLSDFIVPYELYDGLCMNLPPVEQFRILQLPVKNRKYFGQWINAVWDEEASVAVIATAPEAFIDSERRDGYRILTADAHKEVQLKGTTAALIVSGGKEDFLNVVDKFEHDFDLPLGVESRRNPMINRSIYSARNANPKTIDKHIEYAKKGGFSCMLFYYDNMCIKAKTEYGTCGNYDFNENYPNGYEDLKATLQKVKDAGITPGIHFLHTHIGVNSRYITPVADHRLNLTMHFTLSKPLGLDDDKIYVEENPKNATTYDMCKVLKFGGELMFYEGYSTEYPYHFYGVKRGHWETNVVEHPLGEIGGQLDVTEYSGSSVYINQHSSLQDEIADKLAALYNCGFQFVYFDGSEGTNPPFEFHVPNAQYRVLKKFNNPPLFCEGAAKAHFSWHFITGGNAFDSFGMDIFKKMIDVHPFAEAVNMEQDFTRLNFGWWSYNNQTQKDHYEYGTSRAQAWNCPITTRGNIPVFEGHPRTADILEVMRRWEDVRRRNILSEEEMAMIKVTGQEHTLLINEKGDYELVPYFELRGVGGEDSDISAYTFERCGKAYAVIWHRTGAAKLSIPAFAENIIYERDIAKEKLSIEKSNGKITVEVSDAAYISAEISVDELRRALTEATLV